MKYAIGIDIGGTNTRVALINEQIEIEKRQQFRTDIVNPEQTINEIKRIIDSFEVDYCGVGLSCPGPLDLINQKIFESPNLKGQWHNFEITKTMREVLNHPVYLENDANLAALAEATLGEGKNYNKVQFLTISTGVGAGLVINKKIYIGAHGFANEIANICMWNNGPSHGDIHSGGIEAISSGTAITKRAIDAGLKVNHAGEVDSLALNGNLVAKKIMYEAKQYLANTIGCIYGIIDPDIIVLGGSVAIKIPNFIEEVEIMVKSQVYRNIEPLVKIVKSSLGEDSGLLGAAYLALKNNI